MILSQIQRVAGSKVTVKGISGSGVVKWRFKDANAHKSYGIRTYSANKNETSSSVGQAIKSQANRL